MFCIFKCIILTQVFFFTSESVRFYQVEVNRSEYSSATTNRKNSNSIRKNNLWRKRFLISVLSHREPLRLSARSKLTANSSIPIRQQTTRIFTENQGNESEYFQHSKTDTSSNPLPSRKSHVLIPNRAAADEYGLNGQKTDQEQNQRDAAFIGFAPSLSGKRNFTTKIPLHFSGHRSAFAQELMQRKNENSGGSGKRLARLQVGRRLEKRSGRPSFHREGDSRSRTVTAFNILAKDFECLMLFLAGHKYFGFDPRKGSELSWKYRKKGFYTSFPRPRLKKLHAKVVELCSHGAFRCVRGIAYEARLTSLMANTKCSKRTKKVKLPYFLPFKDAIDLFRFRTSATYYLCWLAVTQHSIMKHLNTNRHNRCIRGLSALREQFDNQRQIVDYRQDLLAYQCALVVFCPDPCFGRKTKGMVLSDDFAKNHDPGNPCRGLKVKTCKWLVGKRNGNFEDLQRNRFNISCACDSEQKGFAWDSKYHLCVDEDECQDKTVRGRCSRTGKRCQNLPGGYECVCRAGQVLDPRTSLCQQKVQILRPTINYTLLEARYLHRMMQPEGTGTFLRKQLEKFLGLSRGCCSGCHLLLQLAAIAFSILL